MPVASKPFSVAASTMAETIFAMSCSSTAGNDTVMIGSFAGFLALRASCSLPLGAMTDRSIEY